MGYLRFSEVRRRVGLSRSTIWRLERRGLFVKRRRLSANAVGWPEDEIEAWLRARRGVSEDRSIETESTGPPTLLDWLQGMTSRSVAGEGRKPASHRPGR
jgi:prophage regulatory protein